MIICTRQCDGLLQRHRLALSPHGVCRRFAQCVPRWCHEALDPRGLGGWERGKQFALPRSATGKTERPPVTALDGGQSRELLKC